MALENTRKKLRQIQNKYVDELQNAVIELKPDYSRKYNGNREGYYGISDDDRDFIYDSIGYLRQEVINEDGPFSFDIEKYYISEKKAIQSLEETKEQIHAHLLTLKEIEKKYRDREDVQQHPIRICLDFYENISELLLEICTSDEYIESKRPGAAEQFRLENIDLKFDKHWRKMYRTYILHLISFLIFLLIIGWLIILKDDTEVAKPYKVAIAIILGITSIIFNIGFNNYPSFKDSFKLLLNSSEEELKKKEKEKFLKTIP